MTLIFNTMNLCCNAVFCEPCRTVTGFEGRYPLCNGHHRFDGLDTSSHERLSGVQAIVGRFI